MFSFLVLKLAKFQRFTTPTDISMIFLQEHSMATENGFKSLTSPIKISNITSLKKNKVRVIVSKANVSEPILAVSNGLNSF